MDYLDPRDHPVWRDQLRAGHAEAATPRAVARRLAGVHAATAHRPDVAALFPSDHIFWDIRMEPYLLATARAHPNLAAALEDLAATTARTKIALVHGDVSPKNILVGPDGPLFLDAECACYGDPAFDLAFCLYHLLLKCLWVPAACAKFLACFTALVDAYLPLVTWEAPGVLERRAARLLPALTLARIDGKSPVEYVEAAADKDLVRAFATSLVAAPAVRLADVMAGWEKCLARA